MQYSLLRVALCLLVIGFCVAACSMSFRAETNVVDRPAKSILRSDSGCNTCAPKPMTCGETCRLDPEPPIYVPVPLPQPPFPPAPPVEIHREYVVPPRKPVPYPGYWDNLGERG